MLMQNTLNDKVFNGSYIVCTSIFDVRWDEVTKSHEGK